MSDDDLLQSLRELAQATPPPSPELRAAIDAKARATVQRARRRRVAMFAAVVVGLIGAAGFLSTRSPDDRRGAEVTIGGESALPEPSAMADCRERLTFSDPSEGPPGMRFEHPVTIGVPGAELIFAGTASPAARGVGCTLAFDASTGRPAWTARGAIAPGTIPLVTDGLVVFAETTRLVARDPASGSERWSLPGEAVAPPVLTSRGEVAVVFTHEVVLVNLATGELVDKRPDVASAIEADGQGIYWSTLGASTQAVAYDLGSRREAWRTELGTTSASVKLLTSSLVILEQTPNTVIALDRTDGVERWRLNVPGGRSAYAAAGDVLMVASDDGGVRAIDEGRTLWTIPAGASGLVRPLVGEGTVYVAGGNAVTAIDLAEGRQVWRVDIPARATAMVRVDGALVVGDERGTLFRVDTTTGTASTIAALDGPITREIVAIGEAVICRVAANQLAVVDVSS